jgi:hypothetical protein
LEAKVSVDDALDGIISAGVITNPNDFTRLAEGKGDAPDLAKGMKIVNKGDEMAMWGCIPR